MATFTGYPASYNDSYSVHGGVYGSYSSNNAIGKSSSNNTYSQWYISTGSNAETFIYYDFDLSEIPQNATIDSVTCTAKSYISQTYANRIKARQIQLRNGVDNPIGSPSTISTSSSVLTLSCGTWTREMLNECGICIYVLRGTSSTTSRYYTRLYGATLTVEYTVNSITYTYTASCSKGGTISPTSGQANPGDNIVFTMEPEDGYILKSVTANGVSMSYSETISNSLSNALGLLHFDSDYNDVLNNVVVTNYGTTLNSSVSKFGGNSIYFDKNSYIKIDAGQSAYTLEFWFYRLGSNTSGWHPTIFSTVTNNNSGGTYMHLDDGGYGRYPVYRSNANSSGSGNNGGYGDTSVNANQWYHVAYCRDGSNHRFYLDGQLQYTVTQSNATDTDIFYLGCLFDSTGPMSGCYFNGYIDEVLLSSNIKYTSNFTPPSEPFTTNRSIIYQATLTDIQGDTDIYATFIMDTSSVPSLYIRKNGVWIAATSIFEKQNGVWVEIQAADIDRTKNFKL